MKNRTRNIILAISILVAAGGFTVYTLWNKPHRTVENAKAVEIGARELYRVFSTDSAKARRDYLEQILLVKGEVLRISQNLQKQTVAFLATDQEGAFVNCTFEGVATGIEPGKTVTIKGICGGMEPSDPDLGIPGDLYMLRCYANN